MPVVLPFTNVKSPSLRVEVDHRAEDKSWRVRLIVDGRCEAFMLPDAASELVRLLRERARMAERGVNEKTKLIAMSRGTVMAKGGKVVLCIDLHKRWELDPQEALQLASVMYSRAEIARAQLWHDVEKYQSEVKVKRFWGMDVLTSLQQYERLGS